MARTELPWLLMGRLIRPYALAVSVACAMLGVAIFSDASVWGDTNDVWSALVGGAALLSALLLWMAWWGSSSVLMCHGLILSAGVFAARGAYIWEVSGNWATAGLSFAWVIASGGAYLLESTTGGVGPRKAAM